MDVMLTNINAGGFYYTCKGGLNVEGFLMVMVTVAIMAIGAAPYFKYKEKHP
jgi:hypothetical protein